MKTLCHKYNVEMLKDGPPIVVKTLVVEFGMLVQQKFVCPNCGRDISEQIRKRSDQPNR